MAKSQLSPTLERVYDELNQRLEGPGRRKNVFVIARAYLRLKKLGRPCTPEAVVDTVYKEGAPRRGWNNFDEAAWKASTVLVCKILDSDTPEAVFNL